MINYNQTAFVETGHSRKHPYHPHRGNWKLTPLPPLDVLIHLLLSETIISPLRMAEISSVGVVGSFLEQPNPTPRTLKGVRHIPIFIVLPKIPSQWEHCGQMSVYRLLALEIVLSLQSSSKKPKENYKSLNSG